MLSKKDPTMIKNNHIPIRWKSNKRIFNNAQVSDHFAIIPTGTLPGSGLNEGERKVYDMVVRRFVAAMVIIFALKLFFG